MPDYPEYDRALECLALLPRSPVGVPVSAIAEDLGLLSQREVRAVFDELARRGVKVLVWTENSHRVAGIAHGEWVNAKHIATAYVEARDAVSA
jgi:hypothetical protein